MKCARCGKETFAGVTTEALELENGGLLVVRNIPCYKCGVCGEIMYTGDVVERMEELTAIAKKMIQEITVINYAFQSPRPV